MTKKRIVWLCVLVVAAICAVAWLWPRSMDKVAGVAMEDVKSWSAVDWTPLTEKDSVATQLDCSEESVKELYTFRFTRPYPSWSLSLHKERVCHIMLQDEEGINHEIAVMSDGRLWANGIWHYKLAGGKAELERLNQWLTDVMGEPAGQTE